MPVNHFVLNSQRNKQLLNMSVTCNDCKSQLTLNELSLRVLNIKMKQMAIFYHTLLR